MNVPPALRGAVMNVSPSPLHGAVMNSEFNTAPNNTTRNNKKNKNANKTRKNAVRPFVPVRPLVAPAGGGGAVPTAVEAGSVGGLKYTPGYGKIDIVDKLYGYSGHYDAKNIQELKDQLNEILGERYIIASFPPKGSPHEPFGPKFCDNHGQTHHFPVNADNDKLKKMYPYHNFSRHNIASPHKGPFPLSFGYVSDKFYLLTSQNYKMDNEKYPVPLPDLLIDQIKLIAHLGLRPQIGESAGHGGVPVEWNPVAHIENLKKA